MARALAFGFLIGFPIAASPGPIFFLVLRRTLSRGWRSGLVCGLGVATGDAIYAGLAAFGVAAIVNVLLGQRRWIGLVGGVAIALIGLRTLRSSRGSTPPPHPSPRGWGRFLGVREATPPEPPRWGLPIDGGAHAEQSGDDPVLHRGVCRIWFTRRCWLAAGRRTGCRCHARRRAMVAWVDRRRVGHSPAIDPSHHPRHRHRGRASLDWLRNGGRC